LQWQTKKPYKLAGLKGEVKHMVNVYPKVKKYVLQIGCKPNQERDISINRLDRKIKYAKQAFPNAKIIVKIISHQL